MNSSPLSLLLFAICGCLLLGCAACNSSKLAGKQANDANQRLAFYNVENLFDTQDDPVTFDEEFTPDSKKKWSSERFQSKLDNLCRVVEGMEFPAILGLCEVENAQVVKDFIEKTALSKYQYQYAHFDSPDKRGIDVALLYQSKLFQVLHSEAIPIQFPEEVIAKEPDYTTRDILYVRGIYQKVDTLHLFVNHWPSRRGGLKASEPKRLYVAGELRKRVDQLFSENSASKIIVMGDMNDEPENNSVLTQLQAARTPGPPSRIDYLYNCSAQLDYQGKGSYNYRGNWNMLDQIIVSGALIRKGASLRASDMQTYRQDWMMYTDPKHGQRPSRTYGGPNYYGGFSDHLPVFIELQRDNNS
ncbi:MAG: endonuclease/exonuclease/phosphatase family protein [Bacteroidota bacterium]